MSQHLIMIATSVAFFLGWLSARPLIRRLRAELADATWWRDHDPLTGMPNRVGLHAAHAAMASTPQPIVIMLIDLDDFKPVNDTHGHDTGDDLLIEIGDRIAEVTNMFGGTAARLSGDEFAILLPVRDHGHAADLFLTTVAQPVQLTTDSTPVTVTVTASIGVTISDTNDPLDDVVALRRADIAMYHAKHHGRNRYAVYEPGMTMPANQRRRGPRLRDLRQQRRKARA